MSHAIHSPRQTAGDRAAESLATHERDLIAGVIAADEPVGAVLRGRDGRHAVLWIAAPRRLVVVERGRVDGEVAQLPYDALIRVVARAAGATTVVQVVAAERVHRVAEVEAALVERFLAYVTPRVNPLRRDRVFGWTERERPGMASGEDAVSARPPRTPRPTGARWLGTLALALAAVTSTATVAPAQSADGPPAERTIVATLNAEPGFTVLARAIAVAGLTQELSDAREVTLFAPTDEAFGRLAGGRLDALMRDPAELRRVLAYHVLPGGIEKREKFGMNLRRVTTLEGAPLAIEVRDGRIHAGDAWVTRHDIRARNGVIHAIDRVLTPPARTAAEHRIRTP